MRLSHLLLLILISCVSKNDVETIQLKLSPKETTKLDKWVKANPGPITRRKKPKFRGLIINSNIAHPAQLSLRGDLAKHWTEKIKSWHVELNSSELKGLRSFELIIADDKAYELEMIANIWANKIGLPSLQSQFINASLNGEEPGHYMLTESWGQEVKSLSNWKEVNFVSENNAWLTVAEDRDKAVYKNSYMTKAEFNPLALEISIYRASSYDKNSVYALTRFNEMLNDMKANLNTPDKIRWERHIDIPMAAKWAALAIYFGSEHAILGDNIRWLSAEETEFRFAPMLYDVLPYPRYIPETGCIYDRFARMNHWIAMWFKNEEMKKRILFELTQIVKNPDYDFESEWIKLEKQYPVNWTNFELEERSKTKSSILKNIAQAKETAATDFCYKKN